MNTLAQLVMNEKNIPAIPALITGCFGKDITLSECTKPRLNELRKYILGKVCRNSARVYMANIKAVLNIYADELPGRDLSLLNVKAEATVSVFLDADELKRLEKYARTLRGKERMYALYFLCSAWCGARVSDIQRIGPDSIHRGRLVYVCEKTGARAEVPVKKGLDNWLAELETLRQANRFCERTYNRTIKDICRRAGICSEVRGFRGGKEIRSEKWEQVSTHTARRSFATNLYLSGCDLYTIGRMMGHSSADMTRRYICSGIRDMDEGMRRFFA